MLAMKHWPKIAYFHEGRALSRQIKQSLMFIETRACRSLYRSRSDDTLWRIDDADEYRTRFIVKIEEIEGWHLFDASEWEKTLLLENRGGTGSDVCIWAGCGEPVVKGSYCCVHHLYENGVRE